MLTASEILDNTLSTESNKLIMHFNQNTSLDHIRSDCLKLYKNEYEPGGGVLVAPG